MLQMRFSDLVDELAGRLAGARVHFGHGLDDARGEALAIANFICRTGLWQRRALLGRRVTAAERARALNLARLRVLRRLPLAYITRDAWFAGMRVHVDKRVCIPRSPLAELIEARFSPWLDTGAAHRVVDLCTGSGCIAAACALAFPEAQVTATDISPAALSVAERNVRRLGLQDRVRLRRGDLFAGAQGKFDLVVANPPYVPVRGYESLPREYRHEPRLALEAGSDGLEVALRILEEAPAYLTPDGLLALEVGEVAGALAAARPDLPFLWPEFERGGEGVLLLRAADLNG